MIEVRQVIKAGWVHGLGSNQMAVLIADREPYNTNEQVLVKDNHL